MTTDRETPPCKVHCGHWTGTGWDTGMATHGGAVLLCCWCMEEVEVPYRVKNHPVEGHGPGTSHRHRIYDVPQGWEIAV